MSGSFRIEAAATTTPGAFHRERSKDPKHDHVVLHLDNGKTVTYNDPRRFGFMDLVRERRARVASAAGRARRRAARAATSTPRRLAELFAGSRAPLKSALLDQKRIAGLGNIYVCEALFPRPAVAVASGRRSGRCPSRQADARRPGFGQSDSRRARGSDRGRRLDPARPSSSGRRAGLFPAYICCL